jgi:hypothetical protein
MIEEAQSELLSADLFFYPPLTGRTRELRDVHLHTLSGKIYRGISVRLAKSWVINIPSSVTLHNSPDITERECPISPETSNDLKKKIRDQLFESAAGLS